MSVLKSLKSLFIIEEENQVKPEVPTPAQKKVTVAENTLGAPGKVDSTFMEVLFKAMQAQNMEGFDYLEFKQSLQSLQKMPMDEQTRYQSAYAMAKTMGANPATLIKTAEHYLNVLHNEEQNFAKAVARQQNEVIGSKDKQINQLKSSVQQKQQQIEQLQAEITKEKAQVETLRGEIAEANTKIETTKNNFIASYNALVKQIAADVENMKNYLK